jgi:hypothetical protein
MTDEEAQLHHELLLLIQKCMPPDKKSPYASFLPGFTSLRLLLIQQARSSQEDKLLKSIITAYATNKIGGQRSEIDIAVSAARDFMVMSKHPNNDSDPELLLGNSSVIASQQSLVMQSFNQNIPSVSALNNNGTKMPEQNNSLQGIVHGSTPYLENLHDKNNLDGDSLHDAIILNTFSMSGTGHEFPGTSFGVSPALHSIAASPALGSHCNFASLGNSPTLQPIPTRQGGPITDLAAFDIAGSPISDMLRNDAPSHIREI